MESAVERIEPRFVERVWGSFHLEPWYEEQGRRIGEVWFEAGAVLIKFLFTTEALSVQVHPDDAYARAHHEGVGKTEMWHVLRAEPGARIAVGFRETVSAERVREAAAGGTIEGLLAWHGVEAGDTFFVPAGTVHALGAGLAVCEIQQSSDITYRMYDYGRGRELHLEHGLAVADFGPHPGKCLARDHLLADCGYFRVERWEMREDWVCDRDLCMVVLAGEGIVGGAEFRSGEVWKIPAGVRIEPCGEALVLRVYGPAY